MLVMDDDLRGLVEDIPDGEEKTMYSLARYSCGEGGVSRIEHHLTEDRTVIVAERHGVRIFRTLDKHDSLIDVRSMESLYPPEVLRLGKPEIRSGCCVAPGRVVVLLHRDVSDAFWEADYSGGERLERAEGSRGALLDVESGRFVGSPVVMQGQQRALCRFGTIGGEATGHCLVVSASHEDSTPGPISLCIVSEDGIRAGPRTEFGRKEKISVGALLRLPQTNIVLASAEMGLSVGYDLQANKEALKFKTQLAHENLVIGLEPFRCRSGKPSNNVFFSVGVKGCVASWDRRIGPYEKTCTARAKVGDWADSIRSIVDTPLLVVRHQEFLSCLDLRKLLQPVFKAAIRRPSSWGAWTYGTIAQIDHAGRVAFAEEKSFVLFSVLQQKVLSHVIAAFSSRAEVCLCPDFEAEELGLASCRALREDEVERLQFLHDGQEELALLSQLVRVHVAGRSTSTVLRCPLFLGLLTVGVLLV